jgi:capsular polysaccharide biosynthesis protein
VGRVSELVVASRPRDDVPLGWYGSFARVHAWLVGATVLAGLLAGAAAAVLPGRAYTATVQVVASNTPLDVPPLVNYNRSKPSTVDTEAQLLRSGVVLSAAARALGGGLRADQVRRALEVHAPLATRVLRVSFRADGAAAARRGAAEVARQYVALRSRLDRRQRRQEVAMLSTRVSRIAHLPQANADRDTVISRERNSALWEAVHDLDAVTSARVRPAALLPGVPAVSASYPGAAVRSVTGALLGLVFGIGIGLWRSART